VKLTAIILAGGKSSRMGQDKGLVLYRGKRMVEHVVEICRKLTPEILISANNPEYGFLEYRLIEDRFKEAGPIGGIHAALAASETEGNIFCPCDMPGIKPSVFEKILEEKKNFQVVVAAGSSGKIYPVLGYYNKNVLPVIEKQIEKGDFKMQHLLKELNVQTVVFPEETLKNINYPEDLQ
jgi:molybdopterin-guanine dinucleotide biosynthesis protein A